MCWYNISQEKILRQLVYDSKMNKSFSYILFCESSVHVLYSFFCWSICMFSYWENESESHSVMSNSLPPHGLYSPWNSPGQNTGVGRFSLLQGIFLTQGLNQSLLHYRQILYQLSYQGSPKVLEFDIKSEKIYFLKCLEG